MDWCNAAARVEPMMAVNPRYPRRRPRATLVEYCNHPSRVCLVGPAPQAGWDKPHDIKLLVPRQRNGRTPWQMELNKSAAACVDCGKSRAKLPK
jgi:alpha-L-arabinofuranosidase